MAAALLGKLEQAQPTRVEPVNPLEHPLGARLRERRQSAMITAARKSARPALCSVGGMPAGLEQLTASNVVNAQSGSGLFVEVTQPCTASSTWSGSSWS
jgi:hypothetical protein